MNQPPPKTDLVSQLSELAQASAELAALKAVLASQKTYVVTVPRTGSPEVAEFDTPAEAANHLTHLLGQEMQAYVFTGHRLDITRGPNRYLKGPGFKHPLFDDRDDDVDREGWLVDAPTESLPVALPPPPGGVLTPAPA